MIDMAPLSCEIDRISDKIKVRVVEKTMLTPHIVEIRLVSEIGVLPTAEPGAHIELTLPNGIFRQYSIVPTPNRSDWGVAVLREKNGRGGSAYIHDELAVGAVVDVTRPRNLFPLKQSSEYLFLAGGIGITPFLSMIAEAERYGCAWNLVYTGKSVETMAYASSLQSRYGNNISIHETSKGSRIDCANVILAHSRAEVYCCGPTSFIESIQIAAKEAKREVHIEHFRGDTHFQKCDQAFELELVDTGIILLVPAEKSALDVVEDAGFFVPSSCREGTCGTCETKVIFGEIDHRDVILTPEEKAQNSRMMLCVSRAAPGTSRIRIQL